MTDRCKEVRAGEGEKEGENKKRGSDEKEKLKDAR